MNILDRMAFQPSAETLKKWLSTRKPSFPISSISFPGFFSDEGNSSDQNWFIFALIGEVLGLGASIYAGLIAEDIGTLIFAVVVVIVFIILDIFFAIKLHRNEGNKTLILSRMLAFDEDNVKERQEIKNMEYEIKKGKSVDFFYKFGIIIIALTKSIGLFLLEALGPDAPIILYLLIAIIYFIVAYVHIYHTGFFLAYTSTQKAIDKEHQGFAKGDFIAKERVQGFSTPSELRLPMVQGTHSIIKDDENKLEGFFYILKSKGVLIDDDIVSLTASQPQTDSNKIIVFKACRRLQVETFN